MMGLYLTNDNTWMRTVKIDSTEANWYYIAMVWCDEHCTGEYNIVPGQVCFEKTEDAVFYALTHNK